MATANRRVESAAREIRDSVELRLDKDVVSHRRNVLCPRVHAHTPGTAIKQGHLTTSICC
ncbi:hypothetical protein C8R44DRAFT_818016 [Mycena epipterygia]|nr:hypothetical protein C8R44DRAFT_818016 [Mycena epipterygia]